MPTPITANAIWRCANDSSTPPQSRTSLYGAERVTTVWLCRFGGTFVACLARGVPVERAVRLANAAGALAVGKKGPMEGNSTMAELEAILENRP